MKVIENVHAVIDDLGFVKGQLQVGEEDFVFTAAPNYGPEIAWADPLRKAHYGLVVDFTNADPKIVDRTVTARKALCVLNADAKEYFEYHGIS